jgi:peptidoglycan-N-acetylglucosamine deacetylase
MYLTRTPRLVQNLFPDFIWQLPTEEKVLHLTFDDGPIPEVTPWVLDVLAQYDAKATFFCVGDNVQRHPDVFEAVVAAGHAVGNHTQNHLNGWASDNLAYFHNIRHCAKLVQSDLFRPPYGRMTGRQAQFLSRHYKIVMWDVLSGDFDQQLSPEGCLQNVLSAAQSGSVVVFHDSLKAETRLRYALPRTLAHYAERGYRFESLGHLSTSRQSATHRTPESALQLAF